MARNRGKVSIRTIFFAVFICVLALVLILTACGGQSIRSANTKEAQDPSAQASPPSVHKNPDITADVEDLHITGIFNCDQHTVLARDPISYDATAIRQMQAYFAGQTDILPNSLVMAEGGPSCTAVLGITNIGSTTIQVKKAGVQLLTTPQANSFSYRLIDACSPPLLIAPAPDGCIGDGQGNNVCGIYSEDMQIAAASAGTVYDGSPKPVYDHDVDGTPCSPQITLNPTEDVGLTVNLASKGLIYSVALHLTLQTPSGEKKITLSQFPSTLTLTSPDQFTCYRWTGTGFTLVAQGPEALKVLKDPPYRNCAG